MAGPTLHDHRSVQCDDPTCRRTRGYLYGGFFVAPTGSKKWTVYDEGDLELEMPLETFATLNAACAGIDAANEEPVDALGGLQGAKR